MNEPRITYCERSHVYDSAVYRECPYCKKLKAELPMHEGSLGEAANAETTQLQDEEPTEIFREQENISPNVLKLAGWLVAFKDGQAEFSIEIKEPCTFRQYEIVEIRGEKFRFLKIPEDFGV